MGVVLIGEFEIGAWARPYAFVIQMRNWQKKQKRE